MMEKKHIILLVFICSLVFVLNPCRILASNYQATIAPSNLSLSPISNGFLISWTGPGDSVINKIYWGNDDSVSEVNYVGILSTSNTAYEHTGLVPGQKYYYRIMSCSCECSELSGVVSATYQPTPVDVYSLSGTVTVNGAAIQQDMLNSTAAATVTATEVTGANQGNRVSVNSDGTYQMALFPGTYNISVDYWFGESLNGTWINFGSYGYPGPNNVSINADTVQNVDIPLHTLTGTVTDTNGNPVPDVELSYSGPYGYGSSKTSAEPGFEGTYKLYFMPGTYSLQVAAPPEIFPPFKIKNIHITGDSIRNIVLGNDCTVLDQAMAMIPPHLELHLDMCDIISGGATNIYNLVISSHREFVQTILNWAGSEMQLWVYRPDDTLYDQYQSENPPIIVDIPNPEIGSWTFKVASNDTTNENQPVALVAGFTPNQLPVANAKGPYFGSVGIPVTLDASSSVDAEGDIVLYEWDWENDGVFDESTTQTNINHTWHEFYDGTVRLRVTDNEGLVDIDCATVEVIGTAPPDITISVDQDTLWPPNHKMVPVAVDVSSSGLYDTEAVCYITSASSNEPEDGFGDGDTAPDWEITGDLTINLRAERSGSGDGRIYTIMVECTDSSGNTETATTEVTVPHDLGKKKGKKQM